MTFFFLFVSNFKRESETLFRSNEKSYQTIDFGTLYIPYSSSLSSSTSEYCSYISSKVLTFNSRSESFLLLFSLHTDSNFEFMNSLRILPHRPSMFLLSYCIPELQLSHVLKVYTLCWQVCDNSLVLPTSVSS